jgi:molecular chaperone DnaK (HSP70)
MASSSIAVVGIDLGASYCKLAKALRGGVECILNESSNRLTP